MLSACAREWDWYACRERMLEPKVNVVRLRHGTEQAGCIGGRRDHRSATR